VYSLTTEGLQEFQNLLRGAWWRVSQPAEPLIPAICLMPYLPRAELLAALRTRSRQIAAGLEELKQTRNRIAAQVLEGDSEVPAHVLEIIDFLAARSKGEQIWARQLIRRVKNGEYELIDD
jgi:hypothetical protein